MPRTSLQRKLPLGGIPEYAVPPKVFVKANRIRLCVCARVLPTATFCFRQCSAVGFVPGASSRDRGIFESSRGEYHSRDVTVMYYHIHNGTWQLAESNCFPPQERRLAAEAQLRAAKTMEEALTLWTVRVYKYSSVPEAPSSD